MRDNRAPDLLRPLEPERQIDDDGAGHELAGQERAAAPRLDRRVHDGFLPGFRVRIVVCDERARRDPLAGFAELIDGLEDGAERNERRRGSLRLSVALDDERERSRARGDHRRTLARSPARQAFRFASTRPTFAENRSIASAACSWKSSSP